MPEALVAPQGAMVSDIYFFWKASTAASVFWSNVPVASASKPCDSRNAWSLSTSALSFWAPSFMNELTSGQEAVTGWDAETMVGAAKVDVPPISKPSARVMAGRARSAMAAISAVLFMVLMFIDVLEMLVMAAHSRVLKPYLFIVKKSMRAAGRIPLQAARRADAFLVYLAHMNAGTLAYAILAGVLPSLIWLVFWTKEDAHPEPKPLLAAAFCGGALAVIAAIFAEKYIADIIADPSTRYTLWAGCEEIVKFTAVAVIALNTDYNDEPIDAMIYCITVALGFAALENTLFILGPLSTGDIARSIVTENMRFIGATLVHVVSSATVGFALGYAYYRSRFTKAIAGIIGLGAAIALHAAFNLSIVNGGSSETLRAFAWVWGAVVILIVLFEEIKAVRPRLL